MARSRLSGKVAIVTGGSRGIGLAVAAALMAEGADVVVTSRTHTAAQAAADQLNASAPAGAGTATGVEAHAVSEAAAAACIDSTLERFGRLDILVNNAGTNPAFGPLAEQDHARFAKTMDVNLWAPILWTTLAARAYMSDVGGAVVNVASIGGLAIEPNLGVYNATKAALMHVTRQQAFELAPRIRVNAVAPGVVRTRLAEALWTGHEDALNASVALGRIGEPADVANAITFLASDDAEWITGTTLVVDGGTLLGDADFAAKEAARRAGHVDG